MSARIVRPTPDNIALAAAAILRGEVVGMPTETVYGLAGLTFDEEALARIFRAKDRPTFDPLIVHVGAPADENAAHDWPKYLERLNLLDAARLPDSCRELQLLASYWPGPLTLVVPKHRRVPDLATAGLNTVAVRCPRHPVAQALLRKVGQPLAAPSANRFGRISPTCAADVEVELGDRIDLILDGGPCEIGLESTVVHVEGTGVVSVLRPGAVSRDELEERLGMPIFMQRQPVASIPAPSPGMLASHYAPAKPLYLLPAAVADLTNEHQASLATLVSGRRVGLLLYRRVGFAHQNPRWAATMRALSESGDPIEAARNLFRHLRELDADPNVDVILAEPVPDESGLGYAIADRLRRASQPWSV